MITPQGWEPFTDTNDNHRYDDGEPFDDLNGDGKLTTMLIAGDARPDGRRVIGDVRDDLGVSATVVDDGHRRVAIAGIDLASVSLEFTDQVRAGLAQRGVNIDHLVLSASHTHESFDPDPTAERFSPAFEARYWERVAGSTIDAIAEAAENSQPVTLQLAAAEAPLEPGQAIQSDVRAPNVIDNRITIMAFEGADGPVATVMSFGSHPEMLLEENVVSSDYPGQVRRRIEAEYPGTTAVWLTGALGSQITSEDASFSHAGTDFPDTDPSPWSGGSAAKGDAVGNVIADLVIDANTHAARPQRGCGVSTAATAAIVVPVENQALLAAFGPAPDVDDIPVPVLFADGTPQRGAVDLDRAHIASEVGLLRICDAAILSTPFEVAPEHWLGCYDATCSNPDESFMGDDNPTATFTEFPEGPSLRDLVDADFPMVTSLTNDGLGYAVVPAAFALNPERPWTDIWTQHHYDEISSLGARSSVVLDAATRELTGHDPIGAPARAPVATEVLQRYAGRWGERVTFVVAKEDGRDVLQAEVARFGTTLNLIAVSDTEFIDPVLGLSVRFKVVDGVATEATYHSPGEGNVTIRPGISTTTARRLDLEAPDGFSEVEPGVFSDGASFVVAQHSPASEVDSFLSDLDEQAPVSVLTVGDRTWTLTETNAERDGERAAVAVTTDGDEGLLLAVVPTDGDLAKASVLLRDLLPQLTG
ncbi:MAG: hypothetical protein R2754_14090 [Microthrixaceae bacterium]